METNNHFALSLPRPDNLDLPISLKCVCVCVFGLWEEAGVPVENMHEEDMQEKAPKGLRMELAAVLLWGTYANQCESLSSQQSDPLPCTHTGMRTADSGLESNQISAADIRVTQVCPNITH